MLFSTIGIAASDFFCVNLSTISAILGMSESMAGVTFLAFGNGSPDVFSTFAAMSSHSGSLAIGELMGAAGFITAVVAGSMALVREFKVGKKTFVRDVGFFIVAASFSMVFLADGALHLWECCVMIAFYVFYVIVVVVWHWYLGQRRRRREREASARGHFLANTDQEIEAIEEDANDDEDAPAGQRRYRDEEDFEALERASSPGLALYRDEESEEEDGDQAAYLASEVAASMRVLRPRGTRRNTLTPIRPSLVGALEFRSVLNSLQKSRGSQRPIHLRRYSDDPTADIDQFDGQGSSRRARHSRSHSAYSPEYTENHSDSGVIITSPLNSQDNPSKSGATRGRAVSMNDAAGLKTIDSAAYSVAVVPDIGLLAATPTFPQHLQVPGEPSSDSQPRVSTPGLSITPPPSTGGKSRDSSRSPSHSRLSESTLVPPGSSFPGSKHLQPDFFSASKGVVDSPVDSPRTSRSLQRPRLQIPYLSSRESSHSRRSLSPLVNFPAYTDSPLPISSHASRAPSVILFDPAQNSESVYTHLSEEQERRIKWWPYELLPSPQVIGKALFPTLCTLSGKSIWDKFVSVASAPSIFLLAVTLPVVEREEQELDPQDEIHPQSTTDSRARTRSGTLVPKLAPESPSDEQEEPEWQRYRRSTISRDQSPSLRGLAGLHNAAGIAVSTENVHQHLHEATNVGVYQKPDPVEQPLIDHLSSPAKASTQEPRDWSRWLLSLQIFTSPLFVAIIIWANTDERNPRFLIKLVLYSLLGSLVLFGILMLTTSHDRPPKYRYLFCFLGFIVAISWISTIANEVVGVLKAFGVILGISDAILGLTIFAVGNSLGDLVADITCARLGYPVMALSACFGGPMLNILLGIGISGAYMTIREANHRHDKHPDKHIKYKPYQIEVSGTLVVSGITLLVTLVGLLIVVPWNNWIMSRRIGWGLIILWSISTVINLVVEISGVWKDPISGF